MQPTVKPLSAWRRKIVFGSLLTIFLFCLPVAIFYAAGYRYDFSAQKPVFTVTGGFYILADATDSVIYIDDKEVTNARAFRDAFYIQGLEPGKHRVHVQGKGLHTWVKELAIYPHIVTEVESFNLPIIPQVRLITEYRNSSNLAVIFPISSSTPVLRIASSTISFIVSTSTATTTLTTNAEFALLDSLFREKASTSLAQKSLIVSDQFGFATTTNYNLATSSATTTLVRDNLMLYTDNGEVYLRTNSVNRKDIPRYFCTEAEDLEKILVDEEMALSDTIPSETSLSNLAGDKLLPCRLEIRIDRQNQLVNGFDFFPTNTNLVIMHLENGIYVVEADDRAWQNSQLLYPGNDLEMLLYRGGIFIKENEIIFEVLPEFTSS
jgi:hypothetical protein